MNDKFLKGYYDFHMRYGKDNASDVIYFDNKYLVVKWEDIGKYLTKEEIKTFSNLIDKIDNGRLKDGKKNNEYLVINTDENYAYEVAKIMKEHGHYTEDGPISVSTK